jgi:uncharacterized protein YjdB
MIAALYSCSPSFTNSDDPFVRKIPVTGITLGKSATSVLVGGSEQLSAVVLPLNSSNPAVTWSSTDTAVATVSDKGVVTGVKSGTATAVAKTVDGGFTASCLVTVSSSSVAPTGISLNTSNSAVAVGGKITLSAAITPSNATNQNVKWSTNDSSIASISAATGSSITVTGIKSGTATVTAVSSADSSLKASCTVTVTGIPVTSVTVNPTSLSVLVNSTGQISSVISPVNATDQNVIWKSDKTSVAIVDPSGVVTGVAAGTANVTVTTEDGNMTATCVVTVTYVPVEVTGVTLSVNNASIGKGSSIVLSATVAPSSATDQTVSWTSSDTNIATVSSSNGASVTVTGVLAGSSVITVTTADGNYSATCAVTVTDVAASVAVSGANTITTDSGTVTLSAAVYPATVSQIVYWTSDNPLVASIDSSTGVVSAVQTGSVNIYATTTDGSNVISPAFALTISGQKAVAYFVKQSKGTTTASLSNGTISYSSAYSQSGNAFKYVSGIGYYGTNSNGFISIPTAVTGDFSANATITVTAQNKGNNACGIGLGISSGWNATDSYAYALARNSSNVINGYYVSGTTSVSVGPPDVSFSIGTAFDLVFSRSGTNLTYGTNSATNTADVSYFTNGTAVYGSGSVYPCISFNNVVGTISAFKVTDSSGSTLFDLSTGKLIDYVPSSLTVSSSVHVDKGFSTDLPAVATALGGTISAVSASVADQSIATASVSNTASGSTITITGVAAGSTTITLTNIADTSNTATVTVTVSEFQSTDNYGSLSSVAYPVPGAANAYPEGEIALTFDSVPTINTGSMAKIYDKATGTLVDTISFSGESQTLTDSTAIIVGTQMARVSGNTLYIRPHVGKLSYETSYYVAIPTTAITGTLNSTTFTGFSNSSSVATWNFKTRADPSISGTSVSITVDGSNGASSADFHSIQGALSYIGTLTGTTSATVNVAAGTYYELLRYTNPQNVSGQTITITGPNGTTYGSTCVVSYLNGNSINGTSATRPVFYFKGANLVLKNMYFKNIGTKVAVAQAESLYFASGWGYTCAAYNCGFSSWQDTLQISGRAWFYKCYIEGNTDFIWGTADAALFENCSLKVRNDGTTTVQSIAVSRLSAWNGGTQPTVTALFSGAGTIGKGYVFVNNSITVDTVAASLGRDAGTGSFYDQVAFVNNTFSGTGTIANDSANKNVVWAYSTSPITLTSTYFGYVGWKYAGNTGLSIDMIPCPTTAATTTITNLSTEFNTRDAILNRVITVNASQVPTGFEASSTTFDTTALATEWSAPTALF